MSVQPADSIAEFYRANYDRLRRLVALKSSRSMSAWVGADDICQMAFLEFVRHGYTVGDGSWSLLRKIAIDMIIKEHHHRRSKRGDGSHSSNLRHTSVRRLMDVRLTRLAKHREAIPPRSIDRILAEELLGRLPPNCREVVELRAAGFEASEISDRLGRSQRTVERNLQQCRLALSGCN